MYQKLTEAEIESLPKTTNVKRIALCGASGSGKTTLAGLLAEKTKLPFYPSSAGLALPKEEVDRLVKEYGWEQNGHSELIRLSNIKPAFGADFQETLLKTRVNFIQNHPEFIIDRSPIDGVVYALSQIGHLYAEEEFNGFIAMAVGAVSMNIDLVVHCRSRAPKIEVNGSRIANTHFQRLSSNTYNYVIDTYFKKVRVLTLDTWDIEEKLNRVLSEVIYC